MNFIIVNKVKTRLPLFPWQKIKNRILSKNYSLSLVMAGEKEIFSLARRYKKNRSKKIPNVLAFPISKKEGEIFLNLKEALREAKKLGYSLRCYAAFLYIHALLHLAGYDHRSEKQKEKMDSRANLELKKLVCLMHF